MVTKVLVGLAALGSITVAAGSWYWRAAEWERNLWRAPTLQVAMVDAVNARVAWSPAKGKVPVTGYRMVVYRNGRQALYANLGSSDTVQTFPVVRSDTGTTTYRVQVQARSDTLTSVWAAYQWQFRGPVAATGAPLTATVRWRIPATAWSRSAMDSVAISVAQFADTASRPGTALFAAMVRPTDSTATLANLVPGRRYALYATPYILGVAGTRTFLATFVAER